MQAQNLEGEVFSMELEGFEARLFQHEYDHLSGVLFIDRLEEEDRLLVQPTLDELEREFNQNSLLKPPNR